MSIGLRLQDKEHNLSESAEKAAGKVVRSESEKKAVEMAMRLGVTNETFSILKPFFPKEVVAQGSRVSDAKLAFDIKVRKLNSEIDKLGEKEKSDYLNFDSQMRKAGTNTEKMGLREQLPTVLLKAYDATNSSREKYEAEQAKLEILKAANKNLEKYQKNSFEGAFDQSSADAYDELQILAGKATLSNPDAFDQLIEQRKKAAKSVIESFGGKSTEMEKLNALFHEVEQYRNKSGRGKTMYGLGQWLGMASKTTQTNSVIDLLSQMDFTGIKKEVADFNKNLIVLNVLEEAQAEAKSRKMAHATSTIIEGLTVDDLKAHGLSNAVMLREPTALMENAKSKVQKTLIEQEKEKVDEILSEFELLKSGTDKKRIRRLNGLYTQAIVEIGYAIPSVFANSLKIEEVNGLRDLKAKLENEMDKKTKQLGIKPENKTITKEHVELMLDHFNDIARWGEEDVIWRSMTTYWDMVNLFSSAYDIKLKDVQETLDDFVTRNIQLGELLRGRGSEKAKAQQAISLANMPY